MYLNDETTMAMPFLSRATCAGPRTTRFPLRTPTFAPLLLLVFLLLGPCWRVGHSVPIPTNPRLVGCNIAWPGALPQFKIQLNNAHIMKGFVAAGLHATRFPGGNVANCFNWTYERGNYAQTTSLYCSTKIRNLERRIQFIEALGPHSYTVKTAKESWPESLWPPVFDLNVLSATTEEESIELVQSLADQNVDMNAKDALLELGNELYFYQQYGYKFKDAQAYYEFTKPIVQRAREIFPNVSTAGIAWWNCLIGTQEECPDNSKTSKWNIGLAAAIKNDPVSGPTLYDSFTVHAYNLQPQLFANQFPNGANDHDVWQTVVAAFPHASMIVAGNAIKSQYDGIKASRTLHMTEFGIPWFGIDKRNPPTDPVQLKAYHWLSTTIRDSFLEAINTLTHIMTAIESHGQYATLLKHPCLKVTNAEPLSKGQVFQFEAFPNNRSTSSPKCGAQAQVLKHISTLMQSYDFMEEVNITSEENWDIPMKILGVQLKCVQAARFLNAGQGANLSMVLVNRCPKTLRIEMPTAHCHGTMVQYTSNNATAGKTLWKDCPSDPSVLPWTDGPLRVTTTPVQLCLSENGGRRQAMKEEGTEKPNVTWSKRQNPTIPLPPFSVSIIDLSLKN